MKLCKRIKLTFLSLYLYFQSLFTQKKQSSPYQHHSEISSRFYSLSSESDSPFKLLEEDSPYISSSDDDDSVVDNESDMDISRDVDD